MQYQPTASKWTANKAAWQQMAALTRKVGQMNTAMQEFASFPIVHLPAQHKQLDVVAAPDHNDTMWMATMALLQQRSHLSVH